jgi:hypothetical protein
MESAGTDESVVRTWPERVTRELVVDGIGATDGSDGTVRRISSLNGHGKTYRQGLDNWSS